MQEEPDRPLLKTADRLRLVGGEPQGSATLLRELDQILMRRAAAIEGELQEICQVRERIEILLSPYRGDAVRSSA